MKLSNEIKEKIDSYFDNISADKLVEVAVSKYGFSMTNIDIENQSFSTIKKSFYSAGSSSVVIVQDKFDISLAA
jgi:hypothetical protein